jgi:hypothetical protein
MYIFLYKRIVCFVNLNIHYYYYHYFIFKVSFHQYHEKDTRYIRKLRVYIDGDGRGDGVQQMYGIIYDNKQSGILSPRNILPGGVSSPINIERGRHPGWVDLPFATPVVLQPNENVDQPTETRGFWLGLFAAQGGSVIRLYGSTCNSDNRNVSASDQFHSSEAPGEFPNTTVVPFRVSLYAETSGLWSRLLAIVLDSCRLRIKTNHLALSMLMESNRRQIEENNKKILTTLIGEVNHDDGRGGDDDERDLKK